MLVAHIESKTGPDVPLAVDYFWSVPGKDLFDVRCSPELTIGQAAESWDNLARQRTGNGDSTLVYNSVWLADVLRATRPLTSRTRRTIHL
ncbi:hypothetical protein HDC94_000920 [Leifsonia sp. AK011]|nr:hypothetical protein [Leifsonia sp. AK011]